jgi:hypothetical protein
LEVLKDCFCKKEKKTIIILKQLSSLCHILFFSNFSFGEKKLKLTFFLFCTLSLQ